MCDKVPGWHVVCGEERPASGALLAAPASYLAVVVAGCTSQVAEGFSVQTLLRKNILLIKRRLEAPGKAGQESN